MKPLLAVDVDGVLNQLSSDNDPPAGWRDADVVLNNCHYRIRHNPEHGAKLLALAEEVGAELVWCTTWEGHANEHIAPLVGLPKLPWVPLPPGRFSEYRHPGYIKAIALQAYANTDEGLRPFAWFDDDANPSYLRAYPAPHLLVQVHSVTGLQDEHLERAREWLSAPKQSAA